MRAEAGLDGRLDERISQRSDLIRSRRGPPAIIMDITGCSQPAERTSLSGSIPGVVPARRARHEQCGMR
jgi:hypothetical protein